MNLRTLCKALVLVLSIGIFSSCNHQKCHFTLAVGTDIDIKYADKDNTDKIKEYIEHVLQAYHQALGFDGEFATENNFRKLKDDYSEKFDNVILPAEPALADGVQYTFTIELRGTVSGFAGSSDASDLIRLKYFTNAYCIFGK
ncbi:MAG: hypothetical protein ACI3Z7_01360 [Candidatus Aphodosoma sp.]